jgi:hypothetical protein
LKVSTNVKVTYSGFSDTRFFPIALLPAFASLFCLLNLRASFSSYPACLALPLSSRASSTVSASTLYASVLRIGSVAVETVLETAVEASRIYTFCIRKKRCLATSVYKQAHPSHEITLIHRFNSLSNGISNFSASPLQFVSCRLEPWVFADRRRKLRDENRVSYELLYIT